VPGRGPSQAHTAPVRARPFPVPASRRPRASGPAVAVLAPACRARQYPAHAAAVPEDPPADLPLRAPTAVGTAPRKHLAAVPRIPGLSGALAPATYPPYGCRLPAGLTECDGIGIGDSGRAPGARVKGLDHWSSRPGRRRAVRDGAAPGRVPPHRAPDGPFLTSPGLLGPNSRANMEQTWGQTGHMKNDLER